MYAQLGEIKFELLRGFSSYEDEKSSNYAELPLIDGKPKLQRVGENLQEVTLGMSFHAGFCVPKTEYENLNAYRISGEILQLIYGNGDYEGDFVIVSIKKTIVTAADDGSAVHMICDVVLKEYYDTDKLQTKATAGVKNGFAVSSNRPLPVSVVENEPSAELATMQDVTDSKKGNVEVDTETSRVKTLMEKVSGLIQRAQKFSDESQVFQAKLVAGINKIDTSLNAMQNKLNVYTSLNIIAPNLQTELTNAQAASTAAMDVVNTYVTIPGVVNTTVEALAVMGVFNNTVTEQANLNKAIGKLNAVATPLAAVVGIR